MYEIFPWKMGVLDPAAESMGFVTRLGPTPKQSKEGIYWREFRSKVKHLHHEYDGMLSSLRLSVVMEDGFPLVLVDLGRPRMNPDLTDRMRAIRHTERENARLREALTLMSSGSANERKKGRRLLKKGRRLLKKG